jgi:hypothetical protein
VTTPAAATVRRDPGTPGVPRVELRGISKRFAATAALTVEVDDFERFRSMMAASPVNDRWQADMARLIDPCTDPATGFHRRLEEVFRLD